MTEVNIILHRVFKSLIQSSNLTSSVYIVLEFGCPLQCINLGVDFLYCSFMVAGCWACYLLFRMSAVLDIRFIAQNAIWVNNMSTRKRINCSSAILIAMLDVSREGAHGIDLCWTD